MPRLQVRLPSVRHQPSAIGRLREIELQISAILRAYPDLANERSNIRASVRGRSMDSGARYWRRRSRSTE
jgi:hypothetical protein